MYIWCVLVIIWWRCCRVIPSRFWLWKRWKWYRYSYWNNRTETKNFINGIAKVTVLFLLCICQ